MIDVCKVNETTYKAIESKNVFTADLLVYIKPVMKIHN